MTSPLSRPQVGIERLNAVRRASAEQRESMNCKSCRKRKIKCNRLRPTCEACNVFQCACIYDAIPKKRGPKTDALEALLKRVDGLEKRLKDEKEPDTLSVEGEILQSSEDMSTRAIAPQSYCLDTAAANTPAVFSSIAPSFPAESPDLLIDTYFLKVQDKPFHVLDEPTIRQRHQTDQLSPCLRLAIYAVSIRYTNHAGGYLATVRLSEDYAHQARFRVDTDMPTIVGLQTILLVHRVMLASGRGRKAYMLLSTAIGMAIALDLHREIRITDGVSLVERELRRQLFWACYLMDRFTACGSKRPSLISDDSITLRLPAWSHHHGKSPLEGEYFSTQSNASYAPRTGRPIQGSMSLLIDVARVLGNTNRYLAAGGVKGDSHFPWHSLSNLSKIRRDLDTWASGNQGMFADITAITSQPDTTILMLSKMIYHLIHCLIYRPFLPVDLAELRGTGQHQSWQIEATNLCFLHANAIAQLAELGRQYSTMDWPGFTGYCLCTAGTVHVHGAHYNRQEGEVYSASADFLSQEMQHLSELRYTWAGAQHQRDILQKIYICHSDFVKSLASNPLRFSPVFHLEDFFERYPDCQFDAAHISFTDISVETISDSLLAHGQKEQQLYSMQNGSTVSSIPMPTQMLVPTESSTMQTDKQQRRPNEPLITVANTVGLHANDEGNSNPISSISPSTTEITDYAAPFGNSLRFPTNVPFSALPQGQFNPIFGMPGDERGILTNYPFDANMYQQTAMTPGAQSQSGSTHTNEGEKDPFLSLLEQLAENENSRGGPSDLDFFLGAEEG